MTMLMKIKRVLIISCFSFDNKRISVYLHVNNYISKEIILWAENLY